MSSACPRPCRNCDRHNAPYHHIHHYCLCINQSISLYVLVSTTISIVHVIANVFVVQFCTTVFIVVTALIVILCVQSSTAISVYPSPDLAANCLHSRHCTHRHPIVASHQQRFQCIHHRTLLPNVFIVVTALIVIPLWPVINSDFSASITGPCCQMSS